MTNFAPVHFLMMQKLTSHPNPLLKRRGNSYALSFWAERVSHILLDTGRGRIPLPYFFREGARGWVKKDADIKKKYFF